MLTAVERKWRFPKSGDQRVLKLRGDAQQIFVNGEFSGGSSGFWDYTIYVNPYMVVRPEGHYTKHIYVNSQRIASKIGNPEDYEGGDPTVPGSSVGKKVLLEEVVEENFNELFGSIPEIEPAADESLGMSDGGSGGEPHQYWFTSDHLGSSAFVTDASGVAIQHLEYMAFGEVFVDQRRTGFGTPYKFNAKELDCESGYYYYSARYYDPRMARFLSVDPLAGEMPAWGSYTYTFDNPVRLVDPTGMRPEKLDDWVYGASRGIYWDENATSQSTTKDGEVYLGDGFATVSDNDLQTNYNSDGSFNHNSTDDNVLPEVTVVGSRGIGGKDVAAASLDGVGGLGVGMQAQGGSIRLTNGSSSGNALAFKYYKSGWAGGSRAGITTYQLGTAGKLVGRAGTFGTLALGGLDVGFNYMSEGGFGTYTQRATGRTAGSLLGGYGGAAGGAAIGSLFGGVGAIPGAIIGGVLGGYGGSKAGEGTVKYIQNRP